MPPILPSNLIPAIAVQTAPPELAAVRAQALERIAQGDAPSLAIGVTRGNDILWAETLGWADREARQPSTPETLYPVASVSKSLTATGAMALVSRGKLRLDQPIQPFLSEIPLQIPGGAAGPVQVAHLLAHTSGIPHIWHYEHADRPRTIRGRNKLLRANVFLAAPPGERYIYTNLGYGVLAEVIEQAGGAAFQEVMARTLFEPLGMTHTTVNAWVGGDGTVCGYNPKGEKISYRYRLSPDGGAGFLASLDDLLRYALFHSGAVQPPGALREAAIVRSLGEIPAGEFQYLRGWGAIRLAGATLLLSDGEIAGGTALVSVVPEQQIAVVVLCNATGGPSMETALMILSALIPGFGEQFAETVGRIEAALSQPGAPPAGRFDGTLFMGTERIPVGLDFTEKAAPQMRIGGKAHALQITGWERGALQGFVDAPLPVGVGQGRKRRLQLSLWASDAKISDAKISDAKISDAKTSDAKTSDAKTSDAKTSDAKTSGAMISGANWQGIASIEFSNDRPGYNSPHFLVFQPA